MCNFNKQTQDVKEFIHLFMQKAAQSVGGTNFLLALIEEMKKNTKSRLKTQTQPLKKYITCTDW